MEGFSVVNETEVDALLEFPCFLYSPANVGNLISGSSPFSKPSLDIWKLLVCVMLSLVYKILSMTLLAWERSTIVQWLAYSLVLPFLGVGMRIDFSKSCGHWWVFQICCSIECNTLIASSFRVLNSSTRILSHPLALLTTVLPKAYLTSHSRMSDSG